MPTSKASMRSDRICSGASVAVLSGPVEFKLQRRSRQVGAVRRAGIKDVAGIA